MCKEEQGIKVNQIGGLFYTARQTPIYCRVLGKTRNILYTAGLSLPLPPRTSAGWSPTCVFVAVNEARRYLATNIPVGELHIQF
jgi:hypothetical protein